MSRRNQAAGYHCEGPDERIHHLCASTTRDLRRQLRPMRIRVGRWRSVSPADGLTACEWYAGTDYGPGAVARLIGRGGRIHGLVFRHGGKTLRRSKKEQERDRAFWADLRAWAIAHKASTEPEHSEPEAA